ncbi:MAG: hypothetical protein A2087_05400 [Spirochaetes bacterium GWD1_61_31]|nr:MAG: hypothetical protein A2Y37_10535 [Spirochaetes bacterium GWB1_60_80]OHD29760.1 MAG: hypothetical protein A2004_04810 [Spirochaetes bacterium GWC1_61_12]OHD42898.1 MAG: hypothetical protein A2Y35_13985 [Spirochaetes bacterium GWE1_60_18]OHD43476.1 MAG: hypothetical protein A2087_05400 [Spirochaetes bacterium GWD1_61_31]OHD59563.1 MAG: hypothetical protein A2Y32_12570 [Spirochaetes bacterium GWF1_60_12]HAP43764.1 hypothetical protein [Spirochaetaceae bacterium]
MNFITRFIEFLKHLFQLDDPLQAELKKLAKGIAHIKPPYYRQKHNLVLPGFAQDLFLFCSALKPLMDMADRTLAHPDLRVTKHYFDHLIDCRLPTEILEQKSLFTYEGMKARMGNIVRSDEVFEGINHDFQTFLRHLDSMMGGDVNTELQEMQRFVEICRHDWERTLGFFDPGISLDNKNYGLDPQPCEGDQFSPEMIDIYFLTMDFNFSETLYRNFMLVYAKHAPDTVASQEQRITAIFSTLNKILQLRLSSDILLALARLTRHDPVYSPTVKHDTNDFISDYRRRIISQFEKDRERLQRERHENAIAKDIKELFGDLEIYSVEGYDDHNDQYLRRETPMGFTHIKAVSILKTFVHGLFDERVKETIKRILVEGYFDNKVYQNNLANILYQCDRTTNRIAGFESNLKSNSKNSINSIRRYIDEIRHGKDMMPFLSRMVDEINHNAREICEDETGLFQMLSDAVGELLADYKKSSPDIVTNIRTMGGARNKELLGALIAGRNLLDTFVRVMRNFSVIKISPIPLMAAGPPPGVPPLKPVD